MGSYNMDRKRVGSIGEQVATEFLERKSYKILERNYRKPWGEIDIIAEKHNVVRFVEVKTLMPRNVSRENNEYHPEEQAHVFKLQKVARTAEVYMSSTKDSREFQVDVVTVILDTVNRRAKCKLYEQVL